MRNNHLAQQTHDVVTRHFDVIATYRSRCDIDRCWYDVVFAGFKSTLEEATLYIIYLYLKN